jgi:hypothetical protein
VRPSDARPPDRLSSLRLDARGFARGQRPKEMAPKTLIQMCEHSALFCKRRVSSGLSVWPAGANADSSSHALAR